MVYSIQLTLCYEGVILPSTVERTVCAYMYVFWMRCIDFSLSHTQNISCCMVEQEYWTVVSELDSGVVVEYGADLHCSKHGSGFPRIDTARTDEEKVINGVAA